MLMWQAISTTITSGKENGNLLSIHEKSIKLKVFIFTFGDNLSIRMQVW
jgi:hypothetical protein